MKPDDRQKPDASPTRRRFLLGASLGSAGAVVAAVTGRAPVTADAASPAETPVGGGYRLSEHVLHYYRTTRL